LSDNDSFPREHHNDMVRNRRYGRLVIHYEGGAVCLVTKEETVKPRPQTSGNGRRQPP